MRPRSLARPRGGLLVLVVALFFVGCATGASRSSASAEGGIALEVRNNLIPPVSLSIYAVPEFGSRRLVGQVQPGATRVLRFDPSITAGQVRFAAEAGFNRTIQSNPVTVARGDSVRWDVNANIAVVMD